MAAVSVPDTLAACIELAIHVLVMRDDQCVGAGRDALKVAPSPGVRYFHCHEPHCGAQHRRTGNPFGESNSVQSTVPVLLRIFNIVT